MKNDFDGDGRSDIGVFDPATGRWHLYGRVMGYNTTQWGHINAVPVSGDFDGNGRCDFGYYSPAGGIWHIYLNPDQHGSWNASLSPAFRVIPHFKILARYDPTRDYFVHFGYPGTIPVTGDFDGDDVTDIGCYYPPLGIWHIDKSAEGHFETTFGYAGTIPVTGDFDGDGLCDFGCYFPEQGKWHILKSAEGPSETEFGYSGTVPITGDFDGDGKDDIGCYHASSGHWYLFMSTEGFRQTIFGFPGTIAVTGDFDGDGKDDIGCYDPPNGDWYVFTSTAGFCQTRFGYDGTMPLGGAVGSSSESSSEVVAKTMFTYIGEEHGIPAEDTVYSYSYDMDNDGVSDFLCGDFRIVDFYSDVTVWLTDLYCFPEQGNTISGLVPMRYGQKIDGTVFSSDSPFQHSYEYVEAPDYSGRIFRGSWTEPKPNSAYLPIRLLVNGNEHYGWIYMTLDGDDTSLSWYLNSCAYQSVPGKPIRAGFLE